MGEVLISHVDQQGPLGQIPNIWVEVEHELLAACAMQEDWNVNCYLHVPCRKIGTWIVYACGMQVCRREFIDRRRVYMVTKRKKRLCWGGLGHLQDWVICSCEFFITFISVCYSCYAYCFVRVTFSFYVGNLKSWVTSFPFISVSCTVFAYLRQTKIINKAINQYLILNLWYFLTRRETNIYCWIFVGAYHCTFWLCLF
jgi:hypothetical protein